MTEDPRGEQVVQAWNEHRPYLVDLAFRMLGDIGAAEDVVQHEDDPLRRAEPLQHDQQGQPDVVVQGDPVGRVG